MGHQFHGVHLVVVRREKDERRDYRRIEYNLQVAPPAQTRKLKLVLYTPVLWHTPFCAGPLAQAVTFRAFGAENPEFHTGSEATWLMRSLYVT